MPQQQTWKNRNRRFSAQSQAIDQGVSCYWPVDNVDRLAKSRDTHPVQTAAQVLEKHWEGTLPVNPIKIAAAMGIRVRVDGSMDESGIIELTDDGPVILLNAKDTLERRRFTAAHEIGHFALGHLKPGTPKFRDPSANFSAGSVISEEREANNFAAQFLMPTKMVRFLVAEKQITDIAELAKQFGVSQLAMKYRLTNIGLIHA